MRLVASWGPSPRARGTRRRPRAGPVRRRFIPTRAWFSLAYLGSAAAVGHPAELVNLLTTVRTELLAEPAQLLAMAVGHNHDGDRADRPQHDDRDGE